MCIACIFVFGDYCVPVFHVYIFMYFGSVATLHRDYWWRPEPCCCCCYFFLPRCAPNARPLRNCCLSEVYGYMIWRRCMHTPRCSWWHTYDVFICMLRCTCGARSLNLKYFKHICMCDLTVSWSACAVLVARWCVLIVHTSTLCAHMWGHLDFVCN